MFDARQNVPIKTLHFNLRSGPGSGGFSLNQLQRLPGRVVADIELVGDAAEALALCLQPDDAVEVDDAAWAAELLPVAPGVAQHGLHSFLDQRPFEFRRRCDDSEHQAAGRRAQVKVVLQAGECNSVSVEIGQGVD